MTAREADRELFERWTQLRRERAHLVHGLRENGYGVEERIDSWSKAAREYVAVWLDSLSADVMMPWPDVLRTLAQYTWPEVQQAWLERASVLALCRSCGFVHAMVIQNINWLAHPDRLTHVAQLSVANDSATRGRVSDDRHPQQYINFEVPDPKYRGVWPSTRNRVEDAKDAMSFGTGTPGLGPGLGASQSARASGATKDPLANKLCDHKGHAGGT